MQFLRTLWQWILSPRSLFYLLPCFMAILVIGTLAQKNSGLFPATAKYFNAWIMWIGFMPLPAGATVLSLIGINMTAHFVARSQWKMPGLGTTLTHLGVLVLLFGGLVTLLTKEEGFVILRHGQPTAAMIDYHDRELVVTKRGEPSHIFQHTELSVGQIIKLDQSDLVIEKILPNSELVEKKSPDKNCNGLACSFQLIEKPRKADDESNQIGLEFSINQRDFIASEFIDGPVTFGPYTIVFRRASKTLPFRLALTGFEKNTYPGSDTAKSYRSDLDVMEKNLRWPATIEMNAPLRYRTYTFYQASVLGLASGETASVLNVVKNQGWLFPYFATALIFFGFILHLVTRRHAS